MKSLPSDLLHVLLAAAESRNFEEAGRSIGLSQAGVSTKLRELQALVRVPLFRLQGKKKVLTQFGQELQALAKKQLAQMDGAFERLERKYLSEKDLVLRVGGRREIFERLAPLLFFEGKLEYFTCSAHEATLRLLDQELDLAISHERPNSAEIVAKKILVSRSQLVVHRKLLKGRKPGVSLARDIQFLKETPSLLYQVDGHLLRDWIGPLGLSLPDLRAKLAAQDWSTLQKLVDEGFGYAVVPDYIRPSSDSVESMVLPTDILPEVNFYLLYHRDLKGVPAAAGLLSRWPRSSS